MRTNGTVDWNSPQPGLSGVARDYQVIWTELATRFQAIRSQDIPGFNEVLRRAGLPELYVPRPISRGASLR